MASSSPFKTCISITRGSPNSRKSSSSIPSHSDSENVKTNNKFRLSKSTSFLRKPFQRNELDPKTIGRRRFTFSGHQDQKIICRKKRRFTSIALPTKFLLGGNIKDPLNLRSLEDEKINQQLNAFTPESSPMPMSRHRTQVKLLIPPNINDPLNLNTGADIEFNLLSAKPRKRRRHRKSRREEHDRYFDSSLETSNLDCQSFSKSCSNLSVEEHEKEIKPLQISTSLPEERPVTDKIVSPVVPQGSPAKFYKRFHSRSFSKEIDDKPVSKQVVRRRRSKSKQPQHSESAKFRPNAERFCYGNHLINYPNFDSLEEEDQRFSLFSKELFHGKNVLDIGCNTGNVALYIAKYLEPYTVVGVDIDKRLLDLAEKTLNRHLSETIAKNIDFPASLSVMYGPLAKLTFSHDSHGRKVFPNNVTFLEANYVPSCNEQLEGQKEEFDVVLCLRVTKWIHLNWGDKGLKLAFKRMFAQLHVGGHLILEPQPWFTYSSKKKITPAIYENYCAIELKPEKFCEYLLSEEVGFHSCQYLGQTVSSTKGYRQPIYLLTKGFNDDSMCEQNVQMEDMLSPMPYFPSEWHHPSEQASCSMWQDSDMIPDYSMDNLEQDH